MRAIKFRGKALDSGEWVYGDLHTLCDRPHIHTNPSPYPYAGKRSFIDPETVGQFTGLKDKNGKEIYEGDVLKTRFSHFPFGVVAWHNDGYFFIDTFFGKRDCVTDTYSPIGEFMSKLVREDLQIEVLGNIFDNKELLKGE